LPEVSLGIFPGAGGTQRLPRLIGQARALDIILNGRRLKAQEAAAAGLVHAAVAPEEFDNYVLAYAQRLASGPTRALAAAKANVLRALDVPLAEGLSREVSDFVEILGTRDAQEGVAAFLEKRAPNFRGE